MSGWNRFLGWNKGLAIGAAVVICAASATAVAAGRGSDERSTAGASRPAGPGIVWAKPFAKVAPLDPPSVYGHVTLLEGPAFGPDGRLYFVDSTAGPGSGKVSRLDLRTKKVTTLHSDATSDLTSLQFSPADGKIYMTGFAAGTIYRMDPSGADFRTVFSGPVAGRTMVADDIAFDKPGAMFVTDYAGTPFAPTGRVVRLDKDATNPTVLQTGLSAPNGISFKPDYTGLWVSELNTGQEFLLGLSAQHTAVTSARISMRANIGTAAFDSNAVDDAGNVYQCVPLAGKVLVWSPTGQLLATIVVPQNLPEPQLLTTNLAIRPGTRDGYLTVGGGNGGYIYRFPALGRGIRQSNGG